MCGMGPRHAKPLPDSWPMFTLDQSHGWDMLSVESKIAMSSVYSFEPKKNIPTSSKIRPSRFSPHNSSPETLDVPDAWHSDFGPDVVLHAIPADAGLQWPIGAAPAVVVEAVLAMEMFWVRERPKNWTNPMLYWRWLWLHQQHCQTGIISNIVTIYIYYIRLYIYILPIDWNSIIDPVFSRELNRISGSSVLDL